MRFDGKPSRSNWYFQCSRSIVLLGTCREKKNGASERNHTHTHRKTDFALSERYEKKKKEEKERQENSLMFRRSTSRSTCARLSC